jgi:hypothetical protein
VIATFMNGKGPVLVAPALPQLAVLPMDRKPLKARLKVRGRDGILKESARRGRRFRIP